MKWASVNLTLFNPFSFFRHIESNSADSGFACTQACGGDKKRSQFRQNETDAVEGPFKLRIKQFRHITNLASESPQ